MKEGARADFALTFFLMVLHAPHKKALNRQQPAHSHTLHNKDSSQEYDNITRKEDNNIYSYL